MDNLNNDMKSITAKNLNIAYVGDFVNHGKLLVPAGTSILLLLSEFTNIDTIDIYCPFLNENPEQIKLPSKIKVIESYKYDDAFSILKLIKLRKLNYDKIIFNLLPTAYGNSSIANMFGLLIPLILNKLFKMKNIVLVYHNSTFTNDIRKLGYNTFYDRIRGLILSQIEKTLFKNIDTYVLLQLYKKRIDEKIGKNKVRYLNGRYLEAVTSIYFNNLKDNDKIIINDDSDIKILLHGSWGPQKNLELALKILYNLKIKGFSFKLRISGGINHHFPSYEAKFKDLLSKYSIIIDSYLGYVKEKDIYSLFVDTDLIILPYNTPGGHSGVLEQAMFYEIPTVAIDFPEYKEQSENVDFVTLTSQENLEKTVEEILLKLKRRKEIKIKSKIIETMNNMRELIL